MILGELGAEVIKVENPKGGDAARGWGPPFLEGAATCFHAVNRAVGSITVDLADPEDAARLRALILERADAVLHNLKFGALDRYGLGAADLTAAKPSLVFCNLGAFGAVGPLRDKPGYDPMMQAYSGLMSLLGEDGRPPVRVPASIVDMGAGMWAVIGILSALQERGRTGKGGIVDTSLYETGLAWMSIYLAGFMANRELPARHGSGVDMIVPYQAFAAADGYMMVAAGNDNLFRKLCRRASTGPASPTTRASAPTRTASCTAPELIADPRRHLRRASRAPNGPGCSTPPASRTGRSTRSTRSSPTRRPRRSASSSSKPGSELGLVGLPLSFDGVRPAFAKTAPALGEDNQAKLG